MKRTNLRRGCFPSSAACRPKKSSSARKIDCSFFKAPLCPPSRLPCAKSGSRNSHQPWLPCAKGAVMRSMTEGLSARFRTSYPLRHFVTPPHTPPFRCFSFAGQNKSNENSAEKFNGETTACARHTPLNRGFPSLFAPLGQSSLPFLLMLRISYGQKEHNK